MANIPTVEWNESTPTGSSNISQGDDRIREFKTQIRQILSQDHVFEDSGQGETWGKHLVIGIVESTHDPSAASGQMRVYSKVVGDIVELFLRDSGGSVIQVTSGGALNAIDLASAQDVEGLKTFTGGVDVEGSILTLDNAIIDMTVYHAGQATFTDGSTLVTGVGTEWEDNAQAGQLIHKTGEGTWYEIDEVTGDTTLLLTQAYSGDTETVAYSIIPASAIGLVGVFAGTFSDGIVPGDAIADDAIPTRALADAAVTRAKLGAGIAQMKVGSYTGNAVDDREITGVGLDLTEGEWLITIYGQFNVASFVMKTNVDAGYSKVGYFGDANSRWRSDCIKSGASDGFVLGTHNAVNKNGETYTYTVMKAS